jgi:hypothetical protein
MFANAFTERQLAATSLLFQRRRILIEANQMSRCAEAFCDFATVPAQAHRGIQISSATLYGQKIDRFF